MVYAGFWRRFAARLIDSLIVMVPGLLFGLMLPYVGGLIVSLLYFPVFEASSLKGTPGKILMGMAVTDESGGRMTLKQALIRYFVAYLFIGYFFNLFTAKRQTLQDILAGVVVIHRAPLENVDWIGEWTKEFKEIVGSTQDPLKSEASPAPSQDPGAVEKLEALHKLFQSGALTEAEYTAKKEELLKKI